MKHLRLGLLLLILCHGAFGGEAFGSKEQEDALDASRFERKSNISYSCVNSTAPYRITMEFPAGDDKWTFDLNIHNGKDVVFTAKAHENTTFVILNDVIYITDYSSYSSGCAVLAFNLKTKKEVWRTRLKGIGTVAHSKYSNKVALEYDGSYIKVEGRESQGSYVERLSLQTGAELEHEMHRPLPFQIPEIKKP